MKIYQVTKERTDWDGWPKGNKYLEGTFDSRDKAIRLVKEQVKDSGCYYTEKSFEHLEKYSYVSLNAVNSSDHIVWAVTEVEVL